MLLEELSNIADNLRLMGDVELQNFARMHKEDPYMLALAVTESKGRQKLRAAAQTAPVMPQGTVADAEIAGMDQGIAQLAAPNMEGIAAASGGIMGVSDDYDMAVGYADGGAVERYQSKGYTGNPNPMVEGILALDPDFDEQGNPRSTQEAAYIRRRQADAKIAQQRQQTYGAQLAAVPPTAQVERMEEFYKPRRTPEPPPKVTAPQTTPSATAAKAEAAATEAAAKASAPAGTKPAATKPPAAAPDSTALDPMKMAERFLPDQSQAMRDYTDQETMAANAQMARMKELLQGDGTKAYEEREKSLKKQEEAAGAKLGEEKAMALFQAGLQIMGGTSPYAAVNIASGALKGLEGYKDAKKELDKAAREREKMLADIEQARRAEARDDRKTLVTLQSRIDERKDKIRDNVFSAGLNLGLKKADLASGFEKARLEQEGADRRARMQLGQEPAELRTLRALQADPKLMEAYLKMQQNRGSGLTGLLGKYADPAELEMLKVTNPLWYAQVMAAMQRALMPAPVGAPTGGAVRP